MKNLSLSARIYILGIILIGLGLTMWMASTLDKADPWLYLLAVLGAAAQTLKVEGPSERTNYSIAWFVYGFTLVLFGTASTLFVVLVSHLVEWIWHKYPWYIQSFNIGAHLAPASAAGLVLFRFHPGATFMSLDSALGMAVAGLVFIFGNHFLVGLVVWLARGQSLAQSGVFDFLPLFLDFTVLCMGAVTAVVWQINPFASLLNTPPLYLLYHALRVPALQRQVQELKEVSAPLKLQTGAD